MTLPAPKVTVGMAVYRGEAYIAEAIKSVLAETFQDWELLLVNDASPDNSVEVIRTFSDPRIRLLGNEMNQAAQRLIHAVRIREIFAHVWSQQHCTIFQRKVLAGRAAILLNYAHGMALPVGLVILTADTLFTAEIIFGQHIRFCIGVRLILHRFFVPLLWLCGC